MNVGSLIIVATGSVLPGANTSTVDLDTPIASVTVQPLGNSIVNPSPAYLSPVSTVSSDASAIPNE